VTGDFFYKLGRATGMAKQAMQKSKAQEVDGIATLPGHGRVSLIINEKPDGTRIALLKAKGSESTVYIGFDKEQLDAFRQTLAGIRL
jgi:hypothetical protein